MIQNTMVSMKKLFDFVLEARGQLKQVWNFASAEPVSFNHFSENQRAIIMPMHDAFLDKANRGYFDEGVQRDYKSFLYRWDFKKDQVESATQYMQNIASSAVPTNRNFARKVQDEYWRATGLHDTRPSGFPLIQRDNE
jgi:hypothetical protein